MRLSQVRDEKVVFLMNFRGFWRGRGQKYKTPFWWEYV
jgi:hypothetical protein